MNHIIKAALSRRDEDASDTALRAYMAREAAIHRLPVLMAERLARDAAMRSERTRRGNVTKGMRA